MVRYIAVDSGKADTKICVRVNSDGTIKESTFPTRVLERNDRTCLDTLTGVSDTGFIVEYDGKIYSVGDIVSSDNSFTSNQNSKNDDVHKIATLTAIAKSMNNDDTAHVVIGCPIELYSSKVNREKYLNNILPSGRIDISINGVAKHFMISKKVVLPESMGIILAEEKLFTNRYVGIIDVGGLNVNASAVNKGKIIAEACFTEKLGRRAIEKEVKTYAEQKYESSYSTAEIESFVDNGYITDNLDTKAEEESKAYIDHIREEHINKIVKACTQHGWNLRNMNLVFIGGTSMLLKDKIEAAFPKAIVVHNANYANARGFLMSLCRGEGVMTG